MKTALIAITALIILLGGVYFYTSRHTTIIVVEHTFNAPVEKVWKIWSEPESIKQWWGPKDYTAPIIQNDFRVGASYLFSMKSPRGEVHWNTGKYKEIIPLKRIVSNIAFSDETGTPLPPAQVGVPGQWAYEVILAVDFETVGSQTKVRVTESGIPIIMSILAKMGWNQQFDKFEKLL